eukprot:8880303-Pyramimonas_sp.AAC.1
MPLGTSAFVQGDTARTSDLAKLGGATRSSLLMACSSFSRTPRAVRRAGRRSPGMWQRRRCTA